MGSFWEEGILREIMEKGSGFFVGAFVVEMCGSERNEKGKDGILWRLKRGRDNLNKLDVKLKFGLSPYSHIYYLKAHK